MNNNLNYQKYLKYRELYKQKQKIKSILINKYKGGANQCVANANKITSIECCNRIVYFFDNDANNFRDSTKCICVIPVSIKESDRILTEDGFTAFTDTTTYDTYINKLSKGARKYALIIKKRKGIDAYDPVSGITIENLKKYYNLLTSKFYRNKVAAMIFDWDRTLTVMEGVPARYETLDNLLDRHQQDERLSKDVTKHDIVEYYFGGLQRIRYLNKLFMELKKVNIPIYVLSANKGVAKHTGFFHEMLSIICGNTETIPMNNMIYKGQLSKYEYIEDMLPNLCNGI